MDRGRTPNLPKKDAISVFVNRKMQIVTTSDNVL